MDATKYFKDQFDKHGFDPCMVGVEAALNARAINDDREACKSLVEFIRRAWHIVEPSNPYIHGWHIDAICLHLEAITTGQINRLLINIPPGTAKSLVVSVLWPAWEWGPAGKPEMRYLSTSYSADYVKRDSRRMLSLVQSEWFQERWPLVLTREGEASFENITKGFREGVPFSRLTGGRGHRVLIDDPHSTEMAESVAERLTTRRIFTESVPTRLVEPLTSAIVIIMQRLHTEDVSDIALSFSYVHLCLPMEFEAERRCTTVLGFKDPRTVEGELLFPERFPRSVVDRDKAIMGSFAVAGQFQQRPALREGGLFKRAWWKAIKAIPATGIRWVRYWDLAATADQLSDQAAYTVGVKFGRYPDGRFVVGDVVRMRAEGMGVRRMIRDTAKIDGVHVEIGLPQDPGQAGKSQAQDLVLMLSGYIVRAKPETGAKETRAEPVAAQVEAGNVDILEADWNKAFIDELADFPGGKFKDQADALSGAFNMLIGSSIFGSSEEYFTVEGGPIPSTWPRAGAIHIGAGMFNAAWGAFDPATEVLYIYDAISVPRQDIAIHARALTSRGKWIPFLFDLEGDKRSKEQGITLGQQLGDLGVELISWPFDFEQAVEEMAAKFAGSQIRVFAHLTNWFAEYRRLSRDEKGQIAGAGTGILQATGLIAASGRPMAITENRAASDAQGLDREDYEERTSSTGY